ncbi:MAG: phage major capsid protein [Planctomycetes bacterium]|nr:phage major capsid protein [Planctomycetota bacterium]
MNKYPEMWRPERSDNSPEWMEFKRGLPTRFSIPVGQALSRRVFVNGRVEKRDILISTAGTVPTRVFDELLTRMVLASAVLSSNVRMVNTDTGENILMPRLTAFGTASLIAEGGAFTESDPTVNSSISMGAFKFGNLLQVSDELISDSAFDIETFMGQALGTQIGQSIASFLITGSGTAQPEGIMTNCTVGVTSSTAVAGVPSIANVLSLYSSLPAQYRDGASWILHPDTYASIVALNDTQGRSLVLPDLTSAQPLTLLGKPVYLDTNVATTATSAKSIFFGNLAEYSVVRMVNAVKVVASPDFAFANGLVTLRSELRLDHKVLNTDAARCFKGATT